MHEILGRCSNLAARAAAVYRGLSSRFADDAALVQLWRELALEEETHAEVLSRERKSFEAEESSGPFLPDFAERLIATERDLASLEARAQGAVQVDQALAVAVALEQRDLEELYDDLVLQGAPAFRLLAERVEAVLSAHPQVPVTAGLPRVFRRSKTD